MSSTNPPASPEHPRGLAAAIRFLRTLDELSRGNRTRYALAMVAMVGAGAVMYLVPLVPQVLIDGVIEPGPADGFATRVIEALGGRDLVLRYFWVGGVVAVALAAVAAGLTHLRGRFAATATESIIQSLRDRLYDRLQREPMAFHDTHETGDLVQRCTSDVETVRLFLLTQVVEIGRAVVMMLVPLPLMLALSPGLTVAATVLVPIIVVFAVIFFLRIKTAFRAVEESEASMTSTLQENLTGIRVVRAFARQDHERARYGARVDDYRLKDLRMYRLIGIYFGVSDQLCFMQRGIVLAVGAAWVIQGSLAVGTLYFFVAAVTLFIWPVRHMGRVLADLGKAVVALERIGVILQSPTERELDRRELGDAAVEAADAGPEEIGRGAISFRDVHFAHSGVPVLRGIDLEVHPGRTLAIMGPSGAGKSTLIHLLLRFHDPDRGAILLDGVSTLERTRHDVRQRIAVVMQEPFLFSKSLRQNLLLGRQSAEEQEVLAATEAAAVHESIEGFDEGYDTVVGERGVTLSGGQRQRVAIARALLQEPAVLVLDDALSAVDTRTEALILRALRERHGRHTTIVIAHRISTLMHADEIAVLDEGRIVQRGTHTALLADRGGMYARLWRIQTESEHAPGHEQEASA